MRLENLYPNFGTMSCEEQAGFIASFRQKRAQDLENFAPAKVSTRPKKTKLEFTTEEKLLMKSLGLKQKDILALRGDMGTEEKEDTNLFADDTFTEEEDEG